MSVTRTFTVTVVSTGSGNKYFIDGVQQATLNLAENGTYKFDQSDSSNSNHPLRFSTTSDGTHSGGDEYTTGVTSSPISPGNAGAYTQITVAKSAPTLYYYCTQHSGMGGQANTVDDNSYGMWAWNTDAWGDQGPVEIALSGQSATSSVGSVTVSPETIASLTGLSSTSAVGSIISGQLSVVDLTGVSATSEVGDFDNAGTLVGWGRNGWGEEPYGDSFNKLVQPTGLSLTSSVGSLVATPETIASLTGLSSTSAVGSLSFIISPVVVPTGQSATTSVGTVSTSDAIGLTGLGMTSEVGSITPADVMGLTGQQVNSQVGNLIEQTATFVTPTGVSATSSVGSLVSGIGVPLSGVSATSTVGSLNFVFSMDITLTGVQATTELNDDLILKYFGKITPKDSTGYTTKTPKNSTGYTTKTA
jgi:hypothetical protein